MTAKKNNSLSASLEDYLEAILNVADKDGMARSKDIAAVLDVARPSVTGALKLLAKKGLVNYQPYGYVTLTQTGNVQAAKVAKKHDIIKSFFMDILGVDAPVAHKAACKAEHLLGPTIVSRMRDFNGFAKKQVCRDENFMVVIKRFAKAERLRG